MHIEHFESGCSMANIHPDEGRLVCVQIEPLQIGISITRNDPEYIDLSTIPDHVFYSNEEAEAFLFSLMK